MSEELLSYFNRELNYLRPLQAEFAENHPKIAERLRLSPDAVEDAHVRRLIDAFAFLAARIHRKLDDELPELTDALIEVLYPHYLAPIPSMGILQLGVRADLAGPYELGTDALFDADVPGGEKCRFRLGWPTSVWPIDIEQVTLAGRPIQAPPNPYAPNCVSVLRIVLRCSSPEMTFGQLQPDRLRFHIAAQPQIAQPLYEMIMCGTRSIALADRLSDPAPALLPAAHLEPVGFGVGESLLPYRARSFPGYRILTEFFAFPEKFLFFDIVGLTAKTLYSAGNRLELFLYLDRSSLELERAVKAETLALGCAPIVNLFKPEIPAEPIKLSHQLSEYRVVPDSRRPDALEIYSIDGVTASGPNGESVSYRPFFMPEHSGPGAQQRYWHATRRPAGERNPGSEIYLSLVDLDFNSISAPDWTVSVDMTCFNRNLPARLPFGGGNPRIELVGGAAELLQSRLLSPATRTLRPPLGRGSRWRLLSHLALNHLSLEGGAENLREILRLYDFRQADETRMLIDGLRDVTMAPGVGRVAGALTGICRGLDVTIELSEYLGKTGGAYLFAAVIEQFLGLYVSMNSFTRLTARIEGQVDPLKRWPARAGDRILT